MSNDKKYQKDFDRQVKQIQGKISKVFTGCSPDSLYDPCKYIMDAGGKRIRPILVLFSCNAVSGSFNSAYNAALAIELIHNFTLAHDDIMDNADLRRGRDTVHKKYDISTAILSGDNLIAIAYKYLLKDCKEGDNNIILDFTQGIIEVCEGQSLDKDYEIRSAVTIEEYITMITKKTAALLETCCSVGAKLGRGTEKEIKALKSFGKNIGIAFQIQDDLLDILADQSEFGKMVGGDLVEGKKTYLFLKALDKAEGSDKEKFLSVIKNKGIKKEEVPEYRALYEKLGVLYEARSEVKKYTEAALKSLRVLKNEYDKEFFNWLAFQLIQRNK